MYIPISNTAGAESTVNRRLMAIVTIDLTVSSYAKECGLYGTRREESESDCSNSKWERKGTGRQTYDLLSSETSCPRIRARNCLLESEEDDRLARESLETIHLDDDTDYSVRDITVMFIYLLYSNNELP